MRTIGQIANAVRIEKGEKPIVADMTPAERRAEMDRVLGHFGAPAPINLDSETGSDDLWSFWQIVRFCGERRVARRLFPERPEGYVRATTLLSAYASNKATAMDCRRRGDITAASVYESICESIYNRLPTFARW